MVEKFNEKLRDYASLLANVAMNVQPGQRVVVQVDIKHANFVKLLIDALYEAGAGNVIIDWTDSYSTQQRLLHGNDEAINELPPYASATLNEYCNDGAASLRIMENDFDAYNDVAPQKLANYLNGVEKSISKFRNKQQTAQIPWLNCYLANESWAKKVFPDKNVDEALDSLWNVIFKSLRIEGDGKVLEHWQNHIKNLDSYTQKLNEYNFKTLHYENSLGTDLTVELPKDHIWIASTQNKTIYGQKFIANLPTEEVFTSPVKYGSNGKMYSSRPLVLKGNIVDDYCFTLKEGRIIDIKAKKGEEILRDIIDKDPNNAYFGEVALVPHNSSISNLNTIFYSTLFDENAACHIAFGESYPKCYKNGIKMAREDLKKAGLNFAPVHEDCMIGTSDLNITGTTWNGDQVQFFKNGDFAF